MGHAQHLQSPLAPPTLGHQLLAWIHGETAVPRPCFRPDVAAGPDPQKSPAAGFSGAQQQSTPLRRRRAGQQAAKNDQQPLISDQGDWLLTGHTDTLWALSRAVPHRGFMIDTSATPADPAAAAETAIPGSEPTPTSTAGDQEAGGIHFAERYSEILGKVNHTLDQLDWDQMGRIGKSIGILLVVIIAQVLIKGVLDTINLLPILPGLLELLGLVVVGQWSWKNLSTGEKRSAVVSRLQHLKQEYLG